MVAQLGQDVYVTESDEIVAVLVLEIVHISLLTGSCSQKKKVRIRTIVRSRIIIYHSRISFGISLLPPRTLSMKEYPSITVHWLAANCTFEIRDRSL